MVCLSLQTTPRSGQLEMSWTLPYFNSSASFVLKKHACQYCGKAFQSAYHLGRHTLTHTGDLPWRCALCHKGFNQKVNLKVHVTKVHKMSFDG